MDEFLKVLNNLCDSNETVTDEVGWVYFSGNLATEASSMACDLLIDNEGHCNWDNINEVRNAGYRVFAGDQDSFGWLVGCIQKHGDKRVLTYG
jgi:hypothetical protein